MNIAMSLNVANDRMPAADLIPRLATAGFEALDFNFSDQWNRLPDRSERAVGAWLDALAQAAQAANLPWAQAHGPFFNLFDKTPQNQAQQDFCPAAIAACGRLGVPWMVLHPGTLDGPWDRAHRRAVLQGNADFFRSLLPHCERAGVGLAVENIHADKPACPRRFGSMPEDLLDLMDALAHPLVGLCWDTGHARIMKLDQRRAVASLGSHLKAIHVQDNDGNGDDHLLPLACGKAGVNWSDVVAGLREAGYGGAFAYEVHSAFQAVPDELLDDALRHGVRIARTLLGRT